MLFRSEIQMKAHLDAEHSARELKNSLMQDQAEAAQHAKEEQVAHEMSMKEDRVRADLDIEKEKAKIAMRPKPIAPKA